MIRKFARPMLASVYVLDGVDTVLNTEAHVEGTETLLKRVRSVLPRRYAKQLPNDPELVARTVGGAKIGAGSLLAVGKLPRLSAGTLAVLTVPTILARHAFWETQDQEEKSARRNGFITNIALLGGLAITSVDTDGKPGLKWRASKATQQANKKVEGMRKDVQSALPTKSQTEKTTEELTGTAREWFDEASEKVSGYAHKAQDYYEDNKDDWLATAQAGVNKVSDSVNDYAHKAQDYWQDNKDDWLDSAQQNAKAAKDGTVKAAAKAQKRADKALSQAQSSGGRTAKKAGKEADKLQNKADKALSKAQRKLDGKINF